MSYERTVWKNREVEYPRRYVITDNGDGTVTLEPSPGNIIEPGTPITADNMNNIEEGIVLSLSQIGDINDNTLPAELRGKPLVEQIVYVLEHAGKVKSVNGKTGEVVLSASDVGAVPTSRTINGKALTSNITLSASDVGAVPTSRKVNNKALTSDITLSASDVGAVPTSRRVNNKALTSDITIDVSDIPGLKAFKLALGAGASAEEYAVALGMSASAGTSSVALGMYASARNAAVALGGGASATGDGSFALGPSTLATGEGSVALGLNAKAEKSYAVALGREAWATGDSSAALGREATAEGSRSIALGPNTFAERPYTVALGRNASANNDNEGVLGGTGTSATSKWIVPGSFSVSGTKNFEIPHPKPEKSTTHVIRHSSVESPTPGDTLYRWKIQASKDNDIVTIDLPDYFIWLNKDVQIFVTPQGHFGNGYGVLNRETEQLEIHCQFEGEYNVLVIGTRNDDHPSVQEWSIKGVEREIGESWTGETYAFEVDEIIEIEEIKEVSA